MVGIDFISSLSKSLSVSDKDKSKSPMIHRDVSWLEFNDRVLQEAKDLDNPLLERLKFLAITAGNLDEFFMIRVASLERQHALARKKFQFSEATRVEEIKNAILSRVASFVASQYETLHDLTDKLNGHQIRIHTNVKRGQPIHAIAREIFDTEVLPKLPPPESFGVEKVNQLDSLQTGVLLPGDLWMSVPRTLPLMFHRKSADGKRFDFFFLDDLLRWFLGPSNIEVWPLLIVRLTRDGDYVLDLEDADPESIPDVVRTRIGARERGKPIRLQVRGELSKELEKRLSGILRLDPIYFVRCEASLFLNGLWNVVNTLYESETQKRKITYPPLVSPVPAPFVPGGKLFDRLKERDFLLHHPYDSFDAFIEFIRQASEDPDVIQIEQTIYRMDAVSPVIEHLKKAAKSKKVKVVIELRARFDEQNNLRLADELEKAGVEVNFGFGKLKLHAKVALITRKEKEGERRYTHLSTGNYNSKTSRQYTDLAVVTSNEELGSDARHFFDSLYEEHTPSTFKQILIAPTRMARRLDAYIQSEADAARRGESARIIAKMNALVDEGIIESLYKASQAGVKIDLIVRGACSLVPGVKGLSENIRVVSIVDRFLEHSRIYYFENSKKMFLSSADWMPRNFFSRLEIAFPILDPKIFAYLRDVVLPAYLSDYAKARELKPNTKWIARSTTFTGDPSSKLRSQVLFRELAVRGYKGTPLE